MCTCAKTRSLFVRGSAKSLIFGWWWWCQWLWLANTNQGNETELCTSYFLFCKTNRQYSVSVCVQGARIERRKRKACRIGKQETTAVTCADSLTQPELQKSTQTTLKQLSYTGSLTVNVQAPKLSVIFSFAPFRVPNNSSMRTCVALGLVKQPLI